MNDEQTDDERIEQIAEEISERFGRGEQPTLDEYLMRYPELGERITRVFRAIQIMEDLPHPGEPTRPGPPPEQMLAERIGDFRIHREIGRGGMGIVYEAEQISLRRRVALKVLPQHSSRDERRLKRFEIEARSAAALHHTNITPIFAVGHSDGYPYYAMQFIDGPGLDDVIRELRKIKKESIDSDRFGTEARVSAGHRGMAGNGTVDPLRAIAESILGLERGATTFLANITGKQAEPISKGNNTRVSTKEGTTADNESQVIPVRDRSNSDWRLFGSRFDISGSSTGPKEQVYWHNVARIGVQVAEALQHAHTRGVLHRDIKPSNLMIDSAGMVWVTDFGLAKAVDQDALTQTGEMVGTLRYLSPEQFSGNADARSDVFSLGLTLYELATLRPAYTGSTQSELVEQVVRAEIVAPSKAEAKIPRDLETIILKSIHDAPNQRYETAGQLAADLVRYLKDEPIHARRETLREKTRRWVRRNPSLSRALLGIAAITMIALTSITLLWLRAEGEKLRAEQAELDQERLAVRNLNLAESEAQARDRAERQLYIARMNLVERAFERNDWLAAKELLGTYAGTSEQRDFVGFEWRYWNRIARRLAGAVQDDRPVFAISLTPDEGKLFSGGTDGRIQCWDLSDEELIASWEAHDNWISQIEMLPSGDSFATSSYDGTIKIWNLETRELIRTLESSSAVRCFLFDRLNGELISGHADGSLVRWAIEEATPVRKIAAHPEDIYSISQSSDGELIATGGRNGLIFVWDRDFERIQVCDGHQDTARVVQFGLDPTTLYSAGDDSAIWRWDALEGSGREVGRHDEMVYDLKLFDQGRRLVTCSRDETIRLWSVNENTLDMLREIRGHIYTVYQLALSQDESRLYSCGHDKTIKHWDLARLAEIDEVMVFEDTEQNSMSLETVAVAPDRQQIATAGSSRFVFIYSFEGDLLEKLECLSGPIRCIRFSPDGQSLLVGEESGRLWAFDAGREWQRRALAEWEEPVLAIAHAPQSKRVAVARAYGQVTVLDSQNGVAIREFNDLSGHVFAVAWSPDGQRLAGAGDGEAILVWDVESGDVVHEMRDHRYRIYALRYDPHRDELYSGGRDGLLRRWNPETGELISSRLAHGNSIHAIVLTADDQSVITCGSDRLVRIWDRATGELKNTLSAHKYGVADAAVDPTDSVLVSVSTDDRLLIYRADPVRPAGDAN